MKALRVRRIAVSSCHQSKDFAKVIQLITAAAPVRQITTRICRTLIGFRELITV
jgi:hypothetical protein